MTPKSLLLCLLCKLVWSQNCSSSLQPIHLDLQRIQGVWYLQFLGQTQDLHTCEGCLEQTWTLGSSGSIHLNWCCRRNGGPFCDSTLGGATLSYTPEPLRYSYVFFDSPNVTFDQASFLGTDYATYLVGYACGDLPDGTHYEGVWAYSKTPIPAPGFQRMFFDLLQTNGISQCSVKPVAQGDDCSYQFCGGKSF